MPRKCPEIRSPIHLTGCLLADGLPCVSGGIWGSLKSAFHTGTRLDSIFDIYLRRGRPFRFCHPPPWTLGLHSLDLGLNLKESSRIGRIPGFAEWRQRDWRCPNRINGRECLGDWGTARGHEEGKREASSQLELKTRRQWKEPRLFKHDSREYQFPLGPPSVHSWQRQRESNVYIIWQKQVLN